MIAKYPSKCRYCAQPIEVGRDEYEPETKTSFHWDCHDTPKPTARCLEIAERLGFVEHQGAMETDWPVFLLHRGAGDGLPESDRSGDAAHGDQGALWKLHSGKGE